MKPAAESNPPSIKLLEIKNNLLQGGRICVTICIMSWTIFCFCQNHWQSCLADWRIQLHLNIHWLRDRHWSRASRQTKTLCRVSRAREQAKSATCAISFRKIMITSTGMQGLVIAMHLALQKLAEYVCTYVHPRRSTCYSNYLYTLNPPPHSWVKVILLVLAVVSVSLIP